MWLLFITYKRTASRLPLRVCQVMRPIATLVGHSLGLLQKPSKDGEYEMNIHLGLERHRLLAIALLVHGTNRKSETFFWDIDYEVVHVQLQVVLEQVHYPGLGLTLHSLRHGGALQDITVAARDILGVQMRAS